MINLGNIEISDIRLGASQVKAVYFGSEQVWGGEEPTPAETPLCFTAEGSNATVALVSGAFAPKISMQYSTDNSTWSSYTLGTTVTLANKGDKVYFRATDVNQRIGNDNVYRWEETYNNYFNCKNVSVSGKLVSVIRKDMDESLTYTSDACIYKCLFRNYKSNDPHIVSAKDLHLPNLSAFSAQEFMGMFANSTLSAAPAFPQRCSASFETFGYMFESCNKLSSISSPMMTITGIIAYNGRSDNPILGNVFVTMEKFNQQELVLVIDGVSNFGSKDLQDIFKNNNSFTGKFIIDMTSYTSVPTIQSSTINSNTMPANGTFEILVPASLYDTWKVATNWTTWSSYIMPVN